MFTFREQDGLLPMTWCLKFAEDAFTKWKDDFIMHLWEGKNKMSYAKAKAEEQRYIQDAYEDVEMAEPADEEEEEVDKADEEEEESSEAAESEDESDDGNAFASGSKNEQLAVGYKNDLSFVTRGNMIGVFAPKDEKMRFRTAIDRVKNMEGKTFSPRKVKLIPVLETSTDLQMMLHNQDGDMLLLDPTKSNSIYRMDLEYGQVVEEWKVSDDVEVNNIVPTSVFCPFLGNVTDF